MSALGDRVLAGHRREVTEIVGGGIRNVAGGKYIRLAQHLQVLVYMEPPLGVASTCQLLGQGVGAKAHGPDHSPGFDPLAIGEGYAVRIDRRNGGVQDPLDAQMLRCIGDHRADAVAHGSRNLRSPVHHYHPYISVVAQCGAQARGHLGCGFDTCEAATGNDDCVAREQDLGKEVARSVARMLVVYYRRPGGQYQFSSLLDFDPGSDRIRAVLSYARDHLRDDLSVERLADVAHMSVRQFAARHCPGSSGLPEALR